MAVEVESNLDSDEKLLKNKDASDTKVDPKEGSLN